MDTHAPSHPPIEDISIVLSRFQAWTGDKTASHAKNKLKDGVRELTYDEAIGSRRRVSSPAPPKKENPGTVKAQAEPAKATAGPAGRFKTKARKKKGSEPAAKRTMESRAADNARDRPQLASNRQSEIRQAPQPAIQKHQKQPHDFHHALAQSIAILPPSAATPLVVTHRPLSISIRISSEEQALLKMRAEEASMSVSAYLRQCALQVEHLRTQSRPLFTGTPQLAAPIPERQGFFTRLAQRFFQKSPALSLRA